MQRPQSPARLPRRPLLDRLEQPQTQLMPEMRDETALSQITCSPASHTTLPGIPTSHSGLPRVLLPPFACKTPEVVDFQMQVDTDALEPTHQDAMDLDGSPSLPWRNPFDEPDDAYSSTVSKFRLADVFMETAKVTEEWSKVERPQVPLPKRKRLPQVHSPTTRAATKAPLHRLSPRVAATPFDNRSTESRSLPPPNVDRATVSNTAVAPVLEASPQLPTLAGRSVPCPMDIGQRVQLLQELARPGEQERGQSTANLFPNPAVQTCGSSPPKLKHIGTVSSVPPNSPGGQSACQHAQLSLHASPVSSKPHTGDASRQFIEQSAEGQLFAPEQTSQPASVTTAAPSAAPSACHTHLLLSNPEAAIPPHNDTGAPSVTVVCTPNEAQTSTAVASLPPPAPPQHVKTEFMATKLEPSSPRLHPLAPPITGVGGSEALTEATGELLGFAPPTAPLEPCISAPLQGIPSTPPTGPLVDLPSFKVEAEPRSTTYAASQANAMTESRPATPAPAILSLSLGSTIPQPTIPPQSESTAMEVQMTQSEQAPFIPRTPPREPTHTGPMYYSPAAPPPVSRYRRSASPPPRGQNSMRARTPPRRVTPQGLSLHRPTPTRPRYDIGTHSYTEGHMYTDSAGRGRRGRVPIDLRMNSYHPRYADDRGLCGVKRDSYHLTRELEPKDRTYSRGWSPDRYRPRGVGAGSISPAQYQQPSQSECHSYREPNGSEWPHPNCGDLEASAMGPQAGSSRQRHLANENTSPPARSACIRLDTSLLPYSREGSGPHSAGSSTLSRDMSWGSGRGETLQVDPKVSSIGLLAPSVQVEERAPASKRHREPTSPPLPEAPLDCTKSMNATEPAPKRQKLETTSSECRTGQTSVGVAPCRLEQIATHSLQEAPIGGMTAHSSSQPTLADRMGVLNNSSNMRQSLLGPPRGPLISRFSDGPTPLSVSQPTPENSGDVLPSTVTRPLLDRFTSDQESSNHTGIHGGTRFRGRGGRGRDIAPSEPSAFRHQPLQNRLSGGAHAKNNSLLERME